MKTFTADQFERLTELACHELELERDRLELDLLVNDTELHQRIAACRSADVIESLLAERMAEIRRRLMVKAQELADQAMSDDSGSLGFRVPHAGHNR